MSEILCKNCYVLLAKNKHNFVSFHVAAVPVEVTTKSLWLNCSECKEVTRWQQEAASAEFLAVGGSSERALKTLDCHRQP